MIYSGYLREFPHYLMVSADVRAYVIYRDGSGDVLTSGEPLTRLSFCCTPLYL